MSKMFPDNFLWGAATAAHQVEGRNYNSDWWQFEHLPNTLCKEPSGDAIDHYNRFEDDIKLISDFGINAYRFSLEWSRIEPAPGEFSTVEIDHYKRVIDACNENGVVPAVTLHHFSSPAWFSDKGGWAAKTASDDFARYVEKITAELQDEIPIVCTINEPNIVSYAGYFDGTFTPGKKGEDLFLSATNQMIKSHKIAYDAAKANLSKAEVGLTLSMTDWYCEEGAEEQLKFIEHHMEDIYLNEVAGNDFFGVQTYTRTKINSQKLIVEEPELRQTSFFVYWPEVMDVVLPKAAKLAGVPLYITENGISTKDDNERIEFETEVLNKVHAQIESGLDIRGYFYWSLFDNFEWTDGFGPTFGLFEVDRSNFERIPKKSAYWYKDVIKNNCID